MPAEPVISSYYREGVLHFIINCLIKYVGYSNECYFVGWSKIIIVKLKHLFDSKKTAKFNWAYIAEGFEPGPFGYILSTWIPSSDRNFSHIVKWISPIKSLPGWEFNGAPIAGSTLRSDRQRRSLRPVGPTPQREHTEINRRLFGLLGFIGFIALFGFVEKKEKYLCSSV